MFAKKELLRLQKKIENIDSLNAEQLDEVIENIITNEILILTRYTLNEHDDKKSYLHKKEVNSLVQAIQEVEDQKLPLV